MYAASLLLLSLLFLVVTSAAHAQEPVDLTDMGDRSIGIEVVSNGCPEIDLLCDAPGVYASDPEAEFTLLGEVPLTFASSVGTMTISKAIWKDVLFSLFGESTDGETDPGIVGDTVTDYILTIDTTTLGPGPEQSWEANLIIETMGFGTVTAALTFRPTDTTRASGFLAPVGTDYFFYDPEGLQTSCVEFASAPPMGECSPGDFRGDELYDPATGTFTFLGVVTNQFVAVGLASPIYAPSNFRITEVPEPSMVVLTLVALATLTLLRRTTGRLSGGRGKGV